MACATLHRHRRQHDISASDWTPIIGPLQYVVKQIGARIPFVLATALQHNARHNELARSVSACAATRQLANVPEQAELPCTVRLRARPLHAAGPARTGRQEGAQAGPPHAGHRTGVRAASRPQLKARAATSKTSLQRRNLPRCLQACTDNAACRLLARALGKNGDAPTYMCTQATARHDGAVVA